jgi:hypothetical protein
MHSYMKDLRDIEYKTIYIFYCMEKNIWAIWYKNEWCWARTDFQLKAYINTAQIQLAQISALVVRRSKHILLHENQIEDVHKTKSSN